MNSRHRQPLMRAKLTFAGMVAAAILAACGPVAAPTPADVRATEPATVAESATATESLPPTEEPTADAAQDEPTVLLPTPTADVAATQEDSADAGDAPVTDWTDVVTVEGDYFIRGNPAAPVRLVDYSDFL